MRDHLEQHRNAAPRFIGVSSEHFLVDDATLTGCSYAEARGSCALQLQLLYKTWYLMAVSDIGPLALQKRGNDLTIGPGGQLGLALRPMETVAQIGAEYADLLGEIGRVLAPGQSLCGLGALPECDLDGFPLTPGDIHRRMWEHFGAAGDRGREMMMGTASTTIRIDYRDLDDFNRKFQVANYLTDAFHALFDASPLRKGKPVHGIPLRQSIRHAADPARTTLPRDAWSFEGYVDFLLESKPIFLLDNGDLFETGEHTAAELLAELRFGPEHIDHLLNTVLPPVRYRGTLEICAPDSVPARYRIAIPAVIGELMYRADLLDHYHALCEAGIDYRDADGAVPRDVLLDLLARVGSAPTVDPDGAAHGAIEALTETILQHGSIRAMLQDAWNRDVALFSQLVLEKPVLRADYDFAQYDEPKRRVDWSAPSIQRAEAIRDSLPERFRALGDPRGEFDRIDAIVQSSKALYKGEVVPYLPLPILYHEADLACFRELLAQMHRLCDKMIALYRALPEVRALYGFDPRIERLILLPQDYMPAVPMGRFDIFYYGNGEFQFCELNTDGSSAMNEDAELCRSLSSSAVVREIRALPEVWLESYELFHSWVEAVAPIYEDFLTSRLLYPPEKPRVAIVDFIDGAPNVEFLRFRETFRARGYDCDIVDPRDISVCDGYMMSAGARIDIVYRRLVTVDLLDRYDEIPGFIEGLGQNTCVIGAIHTQVVHSKRFFEMLHHPDLSDVWTDEERAWIARHVPHTVYLTRAHAQDPDILAHREDYIVKPVDSYASRGVVAGCSLTDGAWKQLLDERADAGFILQRYAKQPVLRNIHPQTLEITDFHTITGLFTYGKRLAGLYVRAGQTNIISGLHDGMTLATFGLIVNQRDESTASSVPIS